MTTTSIWSTRILLGTALACSAAIYARAQQQPGQPVPITNDTPAATSKAMPPETTPVPATPTTKGQIKTQRKQQKATEKAADSNAKAAKSSAKARKQSDKAIQDQEKASQIVPPSR